MPTLLTAYGSATQQPTAAEFAESYIKENLTFEQVLQVPGVMRLVKNAHWYAILEAFEHAKQPQPLSDGV